MEEDTQIGLFFTFSILSLIIGIGSFLIAGASSLLFLISAIVYSLNSLWILYWSNDPSTETPDFWLFFWSLVLGFPGAVLGIFNVLVVRNIKQKKHKVWMARRAIKKKQSKNNLNNVDIITKINKEINNLKELNEELEVQKLVYEDDSIENAKSIIAEINSQIKQNENLQSTLADEREHLYTDIKQTIQMPSLPSIEKSKNERVRLESLLEEVKSSREALQEMKVQ